MLTLLAAWSPLAYFVYTMYPSTYVVYSMDSVNLRCLHYKTHQMHIVNTIDLSDPRCLQYGSINKTLFTGCTIKLPLSSVCTHQSYIVHDMDQSHVC